MGTKAKVLVVDDSALSRSFISKALEQVEDAECIGTAASGKIALHKVQTLKPDLVILDVLMPEMDGIETLSRLKEIDPHLQAVMMSSSDMENVKTTLKSLQLGALDFISKPAHLDSDQAIASLSQQLSSLVQVVLTKKYVSLCRQQMPMTSPVSSPVSSPKIVTPQKISSIQLVLIGISTGGPKALAEMVPCFTEEIPCPVLIVQHMPPTFTLLLAESLNQNTKIPVKEAEDGERLQKATVYIAPGGTHLRLQRDKAKQLCFLLEASTPVNNCRPSADVLFWSAAEVVQENILVVVMTGMGRDGTEGVRVLKSKRNNFCLVQDQSSSVVWGMPGSVFNANLADEVVPLELLGKRVMALTCATKV